MADPIEINLWQGEIAELEVDAILIPSNESLFMTGPVSRSVKLRAGDVVEREAVDQGPAAAGTAVVTGAGALPSRHVIHVIGVGHDLRPDSAQLRAAYHAAFEIAARVGAARLATAVIGTERGVLPPEAATAVLIEVLEERRAAAMWLPDALVVVASTRAELAALGPLPERMRAGTA